MKKLKLLLAALALMGAGQAFAQQQDVTTTYLTNANFATGTPIDNGICTYGKDMAGNSTTYYGAQEVSGWTNASKGETDSGYDNSKLAGGLFAYGGTPFLGGAGFTAPATDPDGNAGNALGLAAVWGGSIQYTQDVTLPAGSYTLRFKVYNATKGGGESSGVITTNLFGFVPNEGTAYYAPNKTFAIGQWSTVAVTFKLTAETAGKISMGYVGPSGSAAMPHLFVDNVKILKNTYYEDVTSKVNKTGWTGASDGYQGGSINTARQYGDKAIGRHIYQTVTGLSNGTYEVALYSISQKEWSGSLANDAGDVAYVFAEGDSELKEWINARARNSYPGDDNLGIYTISGVEVTDGTLTIGMGLAQADLTEWHHVQIHSLIYTKNLDLSGVVSAYETALANAQAAAAKTDPMQTSLMTALNDAISTYGNVDKTDGDAMGVATTALLDATTAVENSITAYANAKAYLDEAEPVLDNTNFYTATAYATYYNEPKAKYEASTLTTEEANALNKMGGWHNANTIDDILLSTWTIGGEQCANYDKSLYINTWSTEGNSDGSNFKTPFFEYWVSSGSVAANTIQGEMTGLIPNGLYKVDVWARLQKSGNFAENGITLQVGEGTAIDLTKATQIGSTSLYADVFTATGTADADGKLTVKIVVAENSGCSWLSFKNVKYAELSDERIPYAEQLATAVAEAKSLSTSLVIPDAFKTKLSNAADKYQDYTYASLETVAAFEAAIKEVNDAIETAKGEETSYAAWNEIKAYADALVAVTNDNATANSTLTTAISAQTTAAEAATKAEDFETATSTLKEAMVTYAGAANPVGDGEKFDLTFMLTNPDVSGFANETKNVPGWFSDYNGDIWHQAQVNRNAKSSDNTKDATYEFWSSSAVSTGDFTVYQKLELAKGTYEMSCYAFADANGVDGATNNQVYFYANDTQGSKIVSPTNQLIEASISFVNASEQDVKIGLRALEGNQFRWMGMGYVKLYKVPAKSFTIDEGVAYDNTLEGAGDVTLKRTIKKDIWNTIWLPFSMTEAELKTAFGDDVQIAEYEDVADGDDSKINFNVMTTPAISPLKPVLLKTSTAGTSYTIPARTIVAGTPAIDGTNYDFVGTTAASTTIENGDYFIGNNYLWESTGNTTIAGTRAYIKAKTSNARILNFAIDDKATAIEGIEIEGANDGKIYNLKGQEVKNPQKGVYIQNGKIIIIK